MCKFSGYVSICKYKKQLLETNTEDLQNQNEYKYLALMAQLQ